MSNCINNKFCKELNKCILVKAGRTLSYLLLFSPSLSQELYPTCSCFLPASLMNSILSVIPVFSQPLSRTLSYLFLFSPSFSKQIYPTFSCFLPASLKNSILPVPVFLPASLKNSIYLFLFSPSLSQELYRLFHSNRDNSKVNLEKLYN